MTAASDEDSTLWHPEVSADVLMSELFSCNCSLLCTAEIL
jgi:hypothetical protein